LALGWWLAPATLVDSAAHPEDGFPYTELKVREKIVSVVVNRGFLT
jgi:hypothetical protein